ncbi:hypothetical protein V8C40DRAFT_1464 [Trichoderma camerunense]
MWLPYESTRPDQIYSSLTVRSYYRLSNSRKVFLFPAMPIHVSYLDDRSVLCIANEEYWQRRLARMKRALNTLIKKKGGWTQFDHFRKKEDHIYGGGMFQIRLRCTWTSVSFFPFHVFSFFFPGLAFGPAYHGAFEPSWSVRRWWPPHSDGYTGGTFSCFVLFFDLQPAFYCAFFIFCVFLVFFPLIFVFVQTHSKVCEW